MESRKNAPKRATKKTAKEEMDQLIDSLSMSCLSERSHPADLLVPSDVPLDLGNADAPAPKPTIPEKRKKKRRDDPRERPSVLPRNRSQEDILAVESEDFALVPAPQLLKTRPREEAREESEREFSRRIEGTILGRRTTIYHQDRVFVPSYPSMPYGLLVGKHHSKAATLKDQLMCDFGIHNVEFDEDRRGIVFFCSGRKKQEDAAKVVEEFVRKRSTLSFDYEDSVARDVFDYVSRRKDIQDAGIYLDNSPLLGDSRGLYRITVKGAWWDLDKAQKRVRHEQQSIVEIFKRASDAFEHGGHRRRSKNPKSVSKKVVLEPVGASLSSQYSDVLTVDAMYDPTQKTSLMAMASDGDQLLHAVEGDLGLFRSADSSIVADVEDNCMVFEKQSSDHVMLRESPQKPLLATVDDAGTDGAEQNIGDSTTKDISHGESEVTEKSTGINVEDPPRWMVLTRLFRYSHPNFNADEVLGDESEGENSDRGYAEDGFDQADCGKETEGFSLDLKMAQLLRRIEIDLGKADQMPTRLASEYLFWQIWLQAKVGSDSPEQFTENIEQRIIEKGPVFLESLLMVDNCVQASRQLLIDSITLNSRVQPGVEIHAGGPKPKRPCTRQEKVKTESDNAFFASKGSADQSSPAPTRVVNEKFRRIVRTAVEARSQQGIIGGVDFLGHMDSTVWEIASLLNRIFSTFDELLEFCQSEAQYQGHPRLRDVPVDFRFWLYEVLSYIREDISNIQQFTDTVKMAHATLFNEENEAESGQVMLKVREFVDEQVIASPNFGEGRSPQMYLRDELRTALLKFMDKSLVDMVVTEDSAFRLLLPGAEGQESRRNASECLVESEAGNKVPNFLLALSHFRTGLECAQRGHPDERANSMASVPGGRGEVNFLQAGLALTTTLLKRETNALEDRTVWRSCGKVRMRSGEESARCANGTPDNFDPLLMEFCFRWMRKNTAVPSDGNCGFGSVGLQLGCDAADIRMEILHYMYENPLAINGFFSSFRNGENFVERRAALANDALDGLFSDGHAKILAIARQRRVLIVEGKGYPQRGVRLYTPDENQAPESMRRSINDPLLRVTEEDIVLICNRSQSDSEEHCDALVPGDLLGILQDVPVINKRYDKWEIRTNVGEFKATRFYASLSYPEALLARLLLYRQRNAESERRAFEECFGFPWSEDVHTRIRDEVEKLPGADAFLCSCQDCGPEVCHRATFLSRNANWLAQARKQKNDAGATQAAKKRFNETRRKLYGDFRTQIGFLLDTVVKGGAANHAAHLFARGEQSGKQFDLRDLIDHEFRRFAAYMYVALLDGNKAGHEVAITQPASQPASNPIGIQAAQGNASPPPEEAPERFPFSGKVPPKLPNGQLKDPSSGGLKIEDLEPVEAEGVLDPADELLLKAFEADPEVPLDPSIDHSCLDEEFLKDLGVYIDRPLSPTQIRSIFSDETDQQDEAMDVWPPMLQRLGLPSMSRGVSLGSTYDNLDDVESFLADLD